MKSRITNRIWAIAALAVLALALLSFVSLKGVREAAKAAEWVGHTQDVITEANRALDQIQDAETSARGFLLTGQARDFARFDDIASDRNTILAHLKLLTVDNPTQVIQLRQLDALIEVELQILSEAIQLAREGRADEALVRMRETSMTPTEGLLRQGFASVVAIERELLAQRRAEADRARKRLENGVLIGGSATAAIVLITCLGVCLRLRRAFGDLLGGIALLGAGRLDYRIPETSKDEIGQMAAAFNDMSGHLAETERVRVKAEEELHRSNARLLQSGATLEQRNNAISLLGKTAHRLQAAESETEIGEVVARFVPQILPTIPGALYLLNNSRNLMVRIASWNNPQAQPRSFTLSQCWGLRRGQLHHVRDTSQDVSCDHVGDVDMSGYACLPLLAQADTIGLLYLEASEVPGLGDGTGYDYTAVLAENIALALVNHRLREKLKEQSIRDALTGLFNRRYLQESAQLEFARAERAQSPIGVLMIDIDHFKKFNDTFGHEAGDQVLRAVGQVLGTRLREGDLVCRYGGEEFTALLPGANQEQAAERAELLRQGVKALLVSHHGERLGAISISIGLAMFPRDGRTFDAVKEAADAALYRSKKEGRDRVTIAGGTVPA